MSARDIVSHALAEYPSGLRGRIANPLFAGSNPASAFQKLVKYRRHSSCIEHIQGAPFMPVYKLALAFFHFVL
jgi:hypothetical protein